MNAQIVPGSIADVVARNEMAAPVVVVLVDVSYSMDDCDARAADGRIISRYEAACQQLAKLQARHPGRVAVMAFADEPMMCPGGVPVPPCGYTALHRALAKAKEADTGLMRFVVISDGWPDNEDKALQVAAKFKGAIDTIAIGQSLGGADFLRRLATLTGGTFSEDAATLALAETIETLLALPAPASA